MNVLDLDVYMDVLCIWILCVQILYFQLCVGYIVFCKKN
jgi:hypothetical protein